MVYSLRLRINEVVVSLKIVELCTYQCTKRGLFSVWTGPKSSFLSKLSMNCIY